MTTISRSAVFLLVLVCVARCWSADVGAPPASPSYASVVAGTHKKPDLQAKAAQAAPQPASWPSLKTEEQVAEAATQFTLDVAKSVLRKQDGNAVVSVLGVAHLLSLLQQAADTLSSTAIELEQGLHLDRESSRRAFPRLLQNAVTKKNSKSVLENANNMFVSSDLRLKDRFLNVAKSDYDMNVTSLDFKQVNAAAGAINQWVSTSTHGRIPAIVYQGSLSPRTSLVLASAMYFRGVWQHMFNAGKTVHKLFAVDPTRNVTVFMMQQAGDFRTGEMPELDAQWLELPFDGDHFSMLLVLPNKRHGLADVLQRLAARHVQAMLAAPGAPKHTVLLLPRFQISSDFNLARTLKELGMRGMFGREARLREASDSPLAVSDVIHKAEIKVDEQGATASAASAVVVNTLSLVSLSEDMKFFADHPFLAIIVDRTSKVPLFLSRVNYPESDF